MLTDGRITCFNGVSRPKRWRMLLSLSGSFASYVGRNMLFYPALNLCVLLILSRRNAILLNGWKGSPIAGNNTRMDCKELLCYGLCNLTFKSQLSVNNPW